ncbi:MAG: hypothetical protein IPL99_27025 [Candidatus Competibacteraceae bacterium]|nr:hypothetical protein [Candidatus Competibacteraceae bacterium]
MAQVMLDRLHVLAVVGPLIAGGMVQYVRVDRELDVGVATGPLDPSCGWRRLSAAPYAPLTNT